MTSLGLFKYAGISGWGDLIAQDAEVDGVGTVGGDFSAVLTNNGSASISIECGTTGQSFTVDWGDGSPIGYTAATGLVTPTGTIYVEGSNPNNFKLTGNTAVVTGITITNGSSLTTLNSAFDGQTALTSFSIDDGSNVTDLSLAFRCPNMTSYTWGGGYDSVTSGFSTFGGVGLTSFASASFPALTGAYYMFSGGDFVTIGALDMPNCTNFEGMFADCADLETIAALDTTSTAGASADMFLDCDSLTAPDSSEQTSLASGSGYDYN